MKNFEKYVGIGMLVFAVGFNLWIYRLEPTAKIDPNDNLFQFALVYRTNQIWDFAEQKCSGFFLTKIPCHLSFLVDHWVPNWNEGYNLPFYYSHVPQIAIVGTWRLFSLPTHMSLFSYYHLIIYLILCLFPVSLFFAMRVMKLPWRVAGIAAILASHISTDGLYGLDPPSFLWRGYGLSSQLFAMIFLPLAIAYAWRYFRSNEVTKFRTNDLYLAILFLILTTSGHLGIGIMVFLSLIPLAFTVPLLAFIRREWSGRQWPDVTSRFIRLTLLSAVAIFLLSYWIVPAFLADNFHNFSFWDPVWKFNSYGAKETLTRLINGDLFDFGRLPIFTALVLVGVFVLLKNTVAGLSGFAFLFLFWLLLYFGRTTWGNLINLIPAMKEFHLSRFIVGLHLSGLFLAPIGLTWVASGVANYVSELVKIRYLKYAVYAVTCLLILIPVYRQTVRYNTLNDTLIQQANDNYAKQSPDASALITALESLQKTRSGRVFAGRGGGWGKEFKLAETNMTMYLGNFAFSTVLWLPETWSPNGDTEQYFREDKLEDYDLYNIRYIATPATFTKTNIQPFWKLINENPSWKLYEASTSGYFTSGVRPAVVAADKYSRTNAVRLWIQSDDSKNGLYPELSFDTKRYPAKTGIPNFKMLDEVTYQIPDGSTHNIFAEVPNYMPPLSRVPDITITDQQNMADMIFSAKASVPEPCTECMIILKQTYHPNWRVTVDGVSITPIITFPFYIGIPVSSGSHTIIASYTPSPLKKLLLGIEITGLLILAAFSLKKTLRFRKLRD